MSSNESSEDEKQLSQKQSDRNSCFGLLSFLLNLAVVCLLAFFAFQFYSDFRKGREEAKLIASSLSETRALLEKVQSQLQAIDTLTASRDFLDDWERDVERLSEIVVKLERAGDKTDQITSDELDRAEQSIEFAQNAWDSGQQDLAVVFLLNSLSADDSNAKTYAKYADWVQQIGDRSVSQGAVSLLEEALYKVPPDQVPTIVGLLEEISSNVDPMVPINDDQESPWWTEAFDKIRAEADAIRLGDQETLQINIDELSQVVESMKISSDDMEAVREAETLLQQFNSNLAALQIMEAVTLRFENVEEAYKSLQETPSKEGETAVVSSLHSAELAVNQIWNIPLPALHSDRKSEILALPRELEQLANKVQGFVDERKLSEAEKIWDASESSQSPLYAKRIEERQQAMETCLPILEGCRSDGGKEGARALIETMTNDLSSLRKKQFASYQQWALRTIENARTTYRTGINPGNDEARRAVFNSGLREIDVSLLSPEVGQFFQDVFSQILSEVGGKETAEFQKQIAIPKGVKKRTLEDF